MRPSIKQESKKNKLREKTEMTLWVGSSTGSQGLLMS